LRAAKRHPLRAALLVVGLWVVLGILVPVAVAALPLLEGQREVEAGQRALADAELERAAEHLAAAEQQLGRARLALRNPVAWVGGYFPVLGTNVRAAGAVALGAEETAGAGYDVVAAVLELPEGLDSLRPSGGALPVASLAGLEPALARAADRLARADRAVAAAPTWFVHQRVTDARETLAEQLEDAVPTLTSAHAMARSLPAMLGADGPRRYFFGTANPAEMRGTGGFVGSWTILDIEDGRLDFGEFAEIHDLPAPPEPDAVPPPSEDFAERYQRYGGPGSWLYLNVTPDFTAAGAAFARLYTEAVGEEVDGVIVVDPFAMAALLELAGETRIPGVGTVDSDGVVDYVTNGAYADFDDRVERKEVLGDVAAGALGAFLQHGEGDPRRAIETLGDAVAGGHILLHSTDPDVQADLELAGVAGALPPGPGDLVMPVVNSSSNSKVDYYLEMDATYEVTLLEGGRARSVLSTELANRAPRAGQPKYVIGPNRPNLDPGDNRFVFFGFCAAGCEITGVDRDGEVPERTSVEEEGGLGVAVIPVVEISAGQQTTLSVAWDGEDVWREEDGTLVYELTSRLQPFVTPPSLEVRLRVPEGTRPAQLPDGATVDSGVVRFRVEDVGTRRHRFEFAISEDF
jgi:hypothetical protein